MPGAHARLDVRTVPTVEGLPRGPAVQPSFLVPRHDARVAREQMRFLSYEETESMKRHLKRRVKLLR